jgi:hypothetical protein
VEYCTEFGVNDRCLDNRDWKSRLVLRVKRINNGGIHREVKNKKKEMVIITVI